MVLVLSWDVGVVNLAYCLLKFTEEKYQIISWKKINLVDCDKIICQYNECGKKAVLMASDKASCGIHRRWLDEVVDRCLDEEYEAGEVIDCVCDICDSIGKWHYPKLDLILCKKHKTSHVGKIATRWKIRKVTKKSSQKYPIQMVQLQLINHLDSNKSIFKDVTHVVIENQPSLKNPRMKSIAGTLMNYFLIRGIVDRDYKSLLEVKFMSPSNKLKLDPESNILIKSTDKKYKMTKDLAVKYTRNAIKNSESLTKHFESYQKKDDLADAFLQGLYWYYHIHK